MSLEPQPVRLPPTSPEAVAQAAAVHVADQIAARHPHELDGLMPRLAGKQTAHNPAVRAELLELLDVLGLNDTTPEGGAA